MKNLMAALEAALWSGPLLWLLLGSHIYFTLALKGVGRFVFRGIRLSLGGSRSKNGVSAFGALTTSLAAAIGTGNIIGVATAVALGGPGAVFWCWLSGILGMATRYGETWLGLRYRRVLPGGEVLGGPMYVMEDALHWPLLGKLFAILGIFGAFSTGAMIQSNAAAVTMFAAGRVPMVLTGGLLAVAAGAVLLFGLRGIAAVSEKLVPAMSGMYLLGCFGVLFICRAGIPEAVFQILRGAVTNTGVAGGIVGYSASAAIRYGMARGLFTNEAGMGTAPMAAAGGPGENLHQEALISMTGVFWDTVVICAVTGITLVTAISCRPEIFSMGGGGELCYGCFSLLPGGGWILTVCLLIFAFATIIGWSWYGICCWNYLFDGKRTALFQICYLGAVFLGAVVQLDTLWSLGSILAGLMAVPNLICMFACRRALRAGCVPVKNSCFLVKKRYNEKRILKEIQKGGAGNSVLNPPD